MIGDPSCTVSKVQTLACALAAATARHSRPRGCRTLIIGLAGTPTKRRNCARISTSRRVAHGQRRKGWPADTEPVSARETLPLWTGSYEADHGTSVCSHAPAPPMPRGDPRGVWSSVLFCAGFLYEIPGLSIRP